MNKRKLVISGIVASLILVLAFASSAEAQETVRGSTHFIIKTLLQNQDDIDVLEKRVAVLEQYINAIESYRVESSLIGGTLSGNEFTDLWVKNLIEQAESTPTQPDSTVNNLIVGSLNEPYTDDPTSSKILTITTGKSVYTVGEIITVGGTSKTSNVQMKVTTGTTTIYDYEVFGNAKRGWWTTNIATGDFSSGEYILTVSDEGEQRSVHIELVN